MSADLNLDLWPRIPEFRYRLYARRGDELEVLAACPTPGGIGNALVTLNEDEKAVGRRLSDKGVIGVLDVLPDGRRSTATGEWIASPFPRGERT